MTKKMMMGTGVLVAVGSMIASGAALATGAGAPGSLKPAVKALTEAVHLRPRGIRRTLRARGFYNIVFTDRTLPVYRVRACKNGKRFALRLNRWGDIKRRIRIGNCGIVGDMYGPRRGLSLPEIRRKLIRRGYYNIHYTDRHLPGYRARACKKGKRFVLWLNRWGRIMDRDRRGWCGYGGGYRVYDRYYGPHRGPYIRYDGPGFSISLRKGYRY